MKFALIGYGWGAHAALNSLLNIKNVEIFLLSDNNIKSNKIKIINQLEEIPDDIKLVISSGYTRKISIEFLNKFKVINIHYSLLPSYRGLHSTVWAILNDEKYLGLSIHLMNENFDDGDILHQFKIKNDFKSTSYDYMLVFNKYIENNLNKIIIEFLANKIIPIKQNKCNASWVPRRKKEDCKIDFDKPLNYQIAFFRALVKPYPMPFIEINQKVYIISKVKFQLSSVYSKNGCVVNIDDDGVWVTCKDGYIIIQELLLEENFEVKNLFEFKVGKMLM